MKKKKKEQNIKYTQSINLTPTSQLPWVHELALRRQILYVQMSIMPPAKAITAVLELLIRTLNYTPRQAVLMSFLSPL